MASYRSVPPVDPSSPRDWPQVSLTYRYGATTDDIRIQHAPTGHGGVHHVRVDGVELADGMLPFRDGGACSWVVVSLQQRPPGVGLSSGCMGCPLGPSLRAEGSSDGRVPPAVEPRPL